MARVEVFAAVEIAIVHVLNSTVRRCFLLADDPFSGKTLTTAKCACAVYVDLNPIRAALADTIEGSDSTSAQKRAAGLRCQCSVFN